jgi:hypothetical protein
MQRTYQHKQASGNRPQVILGAAQNFALQGGEVQQGTKPFNHDEGGNGTTVADG